MSKLSRIKIIYTHVESKLYWDVLHSRILFTSWYAHRFTTETWGTWGDTVSPELGCSSSRRREPWEPDNGEMYGSVYVGSFMSVCKNERRWGRTKTSHMVFWWTVGITMEELYLWPWCRVWLCSQLSLINPCYFLFSLFLCLFLILRSKRRPFMICGSSAILNNNSPLKRWQIGYNQFVTFIVKDWTSNLDHSCRKLVKWSCFYFCYCSLVWYFTKCRMSATKKIITLICFFFSLFFFARLPLWPLGHLSALWHWSCFACVTAIVRLNLSKQWLNAKLNQKQQTQTVRGKNNRKDHSHANYPAVAPSAFICVLKSSILNMSSNYTANTGIMFIDALEEEQCSFSCYNFTACDDSN